MAAKPLAANEGYESFGAKTPEVQAQCRERYKQDGPLLLHNEFKITLPSLREAASKGGWAGERSGPRAKRVERVSAATSDNEFFTKLSESLVQLEQDRQAHDDRVREKTLALDDDLPIGIAYWGDMQLGMGGVDYERFYADVEAMANVDGLYVVGLGDYVQNPKRERRSGSCVYTCVWANTNDCWGVFGHWAAKLSGKLIGLVKGNHDAWDDDTNTDRFGPLCKGLDTDNLGHGATVYVQFPNGAMQTIRVRHSYPGESGLNKTNAQRRMYDGLGAADVIALGHKHYNDLEEVTRGHGNAIYLRCGTYLVDDDYGQKLGGYNGTVGVPITIHYSSGEVLPWQGSHFSKALEYLANERAK